MSLSIYHEAAEKVGGKFKLTVLLQKRVRELVKGGMQPLVTVEPKASPIDIALREVMENKISFDGGMIDFKQLRIGRAEETKKETKAETKRETKTAKKKEKSKKKKK